MLLHIGRAHLVAEAAVMAPTAPVMPAAVSHRERCEVGCRGAEERSDERDEDERGGAAAAGIRRVCHCCSPCDCEAPVSGSFAQAEIWDGAVSLRFPLCKDLLPRATGNRHI